MPKKKIKAAKDEYESDDLDDTDTLIARPAKARSRPVSAKRRSHIRPVSARKHRPHSAPPNRTGRDAWLAAVKRGQTEGLIRRRGPESPRHKTPTEYWVDTLRKTGVGISTNSSGMSTFPGGRHLTDMERAYTSTPKYLRQKAGFEKPRRTDDPTVKPAMGTPKYKTPEEYYEDVLDLKKQIKALNQVIATQKTNLRRVEEDNIRKEKEIQGFLDPTKNTEMRRALGDGKMDSSSVIHSLKQKILKLEMQNKDKEASFSKLQSDLKTTKVEEMRVQLEMCFQEIVRLNHSKNSGTDKRFPNAVTGSNVKTKALNETIIRLTKQNEQLAAENKAMREDLNNVINDKDIKKEHEDMSRRELLATITKMERRLEKDTTSLMSIDSRQIETPGKLRLEGSANERIDQLDKRESELLAEIDRQKVQIHKLKSDKNSFRQKCIEKEKEIAALQRLIDDMEKKTGYVTPGRRSPTPTGTPRRPASRPQSATRSRRASQASDVSDDRQRKIENVKQSHAARVFQKNWRQRNAKKIEEEEREQRRKEKLAEDYSKNRAAKHIQQRWTNYRHKKTEAEHDDASELIQAAFYGHQSRKKRMKTLHVSDEESSILDTDDDYNQATDLIRDSLKGHMNRKNRMRSMQMDSTGEEEDDDDDIVMQPRRSSHRPGSSGSYRPGSSSSYQRPGSSSSYQRPGSASSFQRPGSSGSYSRPGFTAPKKGPSPSGSRRSSGFGRKTVDDDDDFW